MNPSMLLENQLLTTKFFVPVTSGPLIPRPRLSGLLNKSLEYPLTLVSAAAGFGKTTLLASWSQSLPTNTPRVAWVSLDEEDNDPRLFWTYVLSALDQQKPERFTPLLKYLQSPEAPALTYVLMALSNLVLDSAEHFVLILDDYHLITEQQVHTTLSYLVEHLPPQLHIVLSTRTDPPLPLSLLRARGQVLEVRTDQLRCTAEETGAFFDEVVGIRLPDETIQEVKTRTEGWLVGLQLLRLSLPKRADPVMLLKETSGDQRYILDYLTDVVLRRQPPEVQTFLLSTCILERLTAPLCDAVMQQTGSQRLLEQLEQANVFVMSLDSKRQWYRYHALFAEALRYRLEQTHADLVPMLHYRASLWYAENYQTGQAILHALHAHQWQWAADLIEQELLPLVSETWGASQHEIVMLRDWLKQLPMDIIHSRPQLCLASALLLLMVASYPMLEGWLDVAEATLNALLSTQADEDGPSVKESLLGAVIGLRGVLRTFEGDGQAALELCQQALALLSPENILFRAQLVRNQITIFYASSLNDAGAAVESGLQAISLAQAVGQTGLTISVIAATAEQMMGTGRLHEIQRLTQQARQMGTQLGCILPEVGYSALFQAEVLREWNQLDAALSLTKEALSLCEQTTSITSLAFLFIGYAVLMRVSLSRGELDAARSALQEFERIGMNINQPMYLFTRSHFTAIDQVRLWLSCGELDRATRWVENLEVAKQHTNPFVREREEVACVRVFLTKKQPAVALERLEPVFQRATAGQRWGHVIEMRLLQALAYQILHEEAQALQTLSEAVRLAEPEGYIRSFVDEGTPMESLLYRLRKRERKSGPTPYLDTLLAALQLT